jgi:hypothetical protein
LPDDAVARLDPVGGFRPPDRAAAGEAKPPLPPDADFEEMRRALIKYRGGVNHFREKSERLQAELQALKAATAAAQVEPAANSVAFVPIGKMASGISLLGWNGPIPIRFQTRSNRFHYLRRSSG